MRSFCAVPPAPEVIEYLFHEYQKNWQEVGLSFKQFLAVTGYGNPAHDRHGLDDGATAGVLDGDVMLIDIPSVPVTGDLHVMVLLVDFPDRAGTMPKDYYEDLLFSRNVYPTGSMKDYYLEVSRGQVNITGEVYGWFRMPQAYTYYTNGHSGLTDQFGREYYPRDARKLAEDAVEAALRQGIRFDPQLDVLRNGTVTALFIVHSGRGAEKLFPQLRGNHIWSHKWNMRNPKEVAADLFAATYLMVPQEALLGVCVHELGHLAFQWQDFYDSNYDRDNDYWDGNGLWDVMASGSYAGGEARPVHPAGLHKLQHGWIEVEEIRASRADVVLTPVTQPSGKVLKIFSQRFGSDRRYILLENRAQEAFDAALPGQGLLVWRVDEAAEQEGSRQPGMLLIEADGRHNLLNPQDRNLGDASDPFPGSENVRNLPDQGPISTSFPDEPESGITLRNISYDPATLEIRLDIDIA